MTGPPVELSVVIPVFGCASCLDELHRRVQRALVEHQISYEVVFVDDASQDRAGERLAIVASLDRRVRVLVNDVNRGQHASIARGLQACVGRWAAVMDCDLQDPPELLPGMLARARRDIDIVVGRRTAHAQSWWRRVGSTVFGFLVRRRHGSALAGSHSVFSVLSRRAVDAYLRRPERTLMYLPVLEALQMSRASVDYDRAPRAAGTSAYGVGRLIARLFRVLSAPTVKAQSTASRRDRTSSAL